MSVKAASLVLLSFLTACSVEDALDLSKDIDATVAVGNGISLPLGSTEEIFLTEMITTGDVLKTDADGNYVITKSDVIDETTVTIDAVEVEVEPISHSEKFDLKIIKQTEDDIEALLQEAKTKRADAIAAVEKAYVEAVDEINSNPLLSATAKQEAIAKAETERNNALNEIEEQYAEVIAKYEEALQSNVELGEINHDITGESSRINYDLSVEIPEGVEEVEAVWLDEPTDLTIDVAIAVEGGNKVFSDLVETIHLYGNQEDEKFYIQVPKFIVFEEGTDVVETEDCNKLYIEGGATHIDDKNIKHLTNAYKIIGFDFTKGDAVTENGKITVDGTKEYAAEGRISASAIDITMETMFTIENVTFDAVVSIGEKDQNGKYSFVLNRIKGVFNPDIDPIKVDIVDLDLGEDMDFVYENGAVFDFANPSITLTINSEVDLAAEATIVMHGLDEYGKEIQDEKYAPVTIHLSDIKKGANVYEITNESKYITSGSISSLLAKVPHKVKIDNIKPKVAAQVQEVTLGDNMVIKGSYDINIPMIFNDVNLTYTETVEDVLGEDPTEVTDYVSEIESVSVEFEALNTVPADFNVEIVALDAYNRAIKGIVAKLVDENGKPITIKAGKGHNEAPVATKVTVKLSVAEGDIEKLCNLDIKLNGKGQNVTLSERASIILKDIAVTIDEPIIVDMN
ncbi:MAG: DUF1542 domain-containing protein [Bacteroidaceae bacterium]|nr:DUF1542 domain-containing protein [Bacteroidaceae bacterium]